MKKIKFKLSHFIINGFKANLEKHIVENDAGRKVPVFHIIVTEEEKAPFTTVVSDRKKAFEEFQRIISGQIAINK